MKDMIIIGGGPAGLTAGIYAKRAGLDAAIVELTGIGGGQVLSTYDVDNYPGLPGISGMDLGDKLKEHADSEGVEWITGNVSEIVDSGDSKKVCLADGQVIDTKTIIIATGATHNPLGLDKEEELIGAGVSYCATCDGAFFRGRTTAVIGGGDVALEDALFLARGCEKVYLIHRRNQFRGAKKLEDAVRNTANIEIITPAVVEGILGEDSVEGIVLKDTSTEAVSTYSVSGIFIAVGTRPVTEFAKGVVDMDESGYIVAGEDGISSCPGIFVAGDARTKALRQIVTAAADGANAVNSAFLYINDNR